MDKIVAWGWNGYGQLGDGTQTTPPGPVRVTGLPEELGVKQLAAGYYHSVSLLDDGSVWAWGDNRWGQLGINSTQPSRTPIQVFGLTNVKAIAAGYSHSLALKNDNTLWAWGSNYYGQLGTSSVGGRQVVPVQVGGLPSEEKVTAIAAGSRHSLAITLLTKTTVWAWGHNGTGQLGPAPSLSSSPNDRGCATPVRVKTSEVGKPIYDRVAGGFYHSLALQSNGVVLAWGLNKTGQLGDGTTNWRPEPDEVKGDLARGQAAILQIAAGGGHNLALAGAHKDVRVWAWGWNWHGALGDGTMNDSSLPVPVVGQGGKGYLANVSAIAAGERFSLALLGDGTVWAWGDNHHGHLGDGTTIHSAVPVPTIIALSGSGIKHIAAGGGHSLAAGQIAL
jgi:alpha-tubulin suppressor-like RCC1 family protein